MIDFQSKLSSITKTLLAESLDYGVLLACIQEYKELLTALSPIDFNSQSARDNKYLASGLAIGPEWAARCVDDFMRTRAFVRGICQAVALKHQSGKPVHILYAGTGPFATLVLPLLSRYQPSEIQLTLLEINPQSFESVQQVFKTLQATDYVNDFLMGDASTIQLKDAHQFDVVIAECLQFALDREPQVVITANLMQQVPAEALLIPQEIALDLCLVDHGGETKAVTESETGLAIKPKRSCKRVFTLNAQEARGYAFKSDGTIHFPIRDCTFSSEAQEGYTMISIATYIKVFGEECIHPNESGLTMPFLYGPFKASAQPLNMSTQYKTGANPGLEIKIIKDREQVPVLNNK
ncbi:MAG TPA: hypothetical protein PLP62_14020 [Flavobacteriaceae bacterium]|nr:hypothetical protein [Flavobacteriaceae bacterium]HQU66473.1 hypothetical protein [Flavobacteriaceae bacterium]